MLTGRKNKIMKGVFKAAAFSLLVGMAPLTLVQEPNSVNINTSGLDTLVQMPGIGSVKAQIIIDDREANGAFTFKSLEDLARIKGIGSVTVEGLRDQVEF